MGMLGPGGAHLYEPGGRFDLTRLVHLLGQFEQRVKSDPAYRASRAAVLGLGPKASAQDVVVAALRPSGVPLARDRWEHWPIRNSWHF